MATIYTGPLQTQQKSFLSNFNPANWFQSTPNTSAYSSPQTQPYYIQPQQVAPTSNPNYSNMSAVQGPTMNNGQFYSQSSIPGANNNTGVVPGNQQSGGGSGSNPNPQPSQPDPNQAIMNEIDNMYNQSIGFANQAESNLRGQYPGAQQEVEGNYGVARKSLEQSKASGEGQLLQAETSAGQRKTDVVNSARRLFNELQMGGQQRFGGASSAGEAYSELTGREFQRGQATAAQGYEQSVQQIQQQKFDLQSKFDVTLSQLENQKVSALRQLKDEFDNKMLQISQMKADAGQNKSSLRLQALQDLRNNAFQLQQNEAQLRSTINAQKAAYDSELDNAIASFGQNTSTAQDAVLGYQGATTTAPTTGLAFGNTKNQPMPQQYTGIRKDDELLTGSINPLQRRDLYA